MLCIMSSVLSTFSYPGQGAPWWDITGTCLGAVLMACLLQCVLSGQGTCQKYLLNGILVHYIHCVCFIVQAAGVLAYLSNSLSDDYTWGYHSKTCLHRNSSINTPCGDLPHNSQAVTNSYQAFNLHARYRLYEHWSRSNQAKARQPDN